ncbi:MAG: nucleotide sugar dehydrogenase [Candidatus Hodarchaeota archaeon]
MVIGLGYVGLPLMSLVVQKGYDCIGFDINEEKIDLLRKRKLPIKDNIAKELFSDQNLEFKVTSDPKDLHNFDIAIICVPTPVNKDFTPDLSPIISASETISKLLKKGELIIVESTIYPGTTEEIIKPILEKSSLIAGEEFFLSHCPERIDPGNQKWTLRNIPRVCGAMSDKGLNKTVQFYGSIIEAKITKLSSVRAAEACKVIENSFRDINIAFVNELAMSFDKMGIDIIEVINGASTKPFAFMAHFPGAGVGGHCIPVDPYYLIKKAADLGFDHQFLKSARRINNHMPYYTVKRLEELILTSGRTLQGQKIGLLGIAFKKGIDDIRNSPYFVIKEELEKRGSTTLSYDPEVKSMSSVSSLDELLGKSDFLVLITDHNEFRTLSPKKLAENKIIGILDGRNVLRKEELKKLGILFRGIGRQ